MLICKRLSKGVEYLVEASEAEAIAKTLAAAKARQSNREVDLPDRDCGAEATPSGKISTLIKPEPDVGTISAPAGKRLHHRVVTAETGGALGGMVRQLSIDQFENEGRKVSYGTPENATATRKLLDCQMSISSVPKKVIAHLLKPRGWKPPDLHVESGVLVSRASLVLRLQVSVLFTMSLIHSDHIREDISYTEGLSPILDRQDRVHEEQTIPFVKILWRNHPEREATWETEESIRTSYPRFLP
ncbi:hypothetical protein Tco_0375596 [Tanacetum coccineum]